MMHYEGDYFGFQADAAIVQNLANDLARRLATVQMGYAPEDKSDFRDYPAVWFEPGLPYKLSSVENRLSALASAWCNCKQDTNLQDTNPHDDWHCDTSCRKLFGVEDSLFARMLE
jgi:hypothetical protein